MPPNEELTYTDLQSKPIKNKNKNRILTTAIHQFAEKGYSAVSIRDITSEVGIKESSLYNHFKSKEDVLKTIFHNFKVEIAKITPAGMDLDDVLTRMSPKEFLKQGLTFFLTHFQEPMMEKIWRIILLERYRNPLARDMYLKDVLEKTFQFLELVFKKYISLNKMQSYDPRILAEEYQLPIFSMIELFILRRIDHKEPFNLKERMTEHLDFFTNQMMI